MRTITTELLPVLVGPLKDGGVFTPMTDPMNSNDIIEIRARIWGESGVTSPEVLLAVQFSDDGLTWPDAPIATGSTWLSLPSAAWNYTAFDEWVDIFNDGSFASATKRLFVRFGLIAKSNASQNPGFGLARLEIELKDVASRTLISGPVAVNTKGSTSAAAFGFTEWMETTAAVYGRATLEVVGTTDPGEVEVKPIYQLANDLDDPSTWSADDRIGSAAYRSSIGITFGTSYNSFMATAAPPSARFIRFGAYARRPSGGSSSRPHTAIVNVRIDIRDRNT